MTEYPILFKGENVQAILDGRKTMTRRVIKPQPTIPDGCKYLLRDGVLHLNWWGIPRKHINYFRCPYGGPGGLLWVRETWCVSNIFDHIKSRDLWPGEEEAILTVDYKANEKRMTQGKWRPSIYMPRWACRITAEIVSLRVDRLQKISKEDAVKEGCAEKTAMGQFMHLWDSINDKRGFGWDANPWVWVIEFKRG